MMESPLVSIVIVTMNHEKFIEKACISAISQTYENIEVIFLDNASSDRTFEIADKIFSGSKVKSKLIKNTHSYRVSKNLNILVSNASGEFISILSGDDWYTENNIEEKMKFMKENPAIDFILTDGYKYYQSEDRLLNAYNEKEKNYILKNINNFFYDNVTENKTVNVGTFVKREILIKYPFDEEINTEDWDMNLRLTSNGLKIGFLDKKLFYYRIVSTSLSRNWILMKESYEKVTNKYIDYITADKTLYKKYRLKLLQLKYEILLLNAADEDKIGLKLLWKKEKYKLKYKNPILFFKLLSLKKN